MSDRERYWRGVVERGGRSGLTVRDFCEEEGVSPASYYQWRRRLGEQDQTGAPDGGPLFVPVGVVDGTGHRPFDAHVEVALPSGVVVRVADGAGRRTIVDVLDALGIGR